MKTCDSQIIPLNLHKKQRIMAYTFVLSDESINSYGTRILTDGIDLSLFQNNPIMLWCHNRSGWGDSNQILPIGKWENVRKENGKLLADAVFDTKDEFAQRIQSKVEQGIINMTSIGVNIIASSEDKSVIVQGQARPTIVKCLITEASMCDIGSNRNALKMCDAFGLELKLSDANNHLLPLLGTINNQNKDETMNLREQLSDLLALGDNQTDEQILQLLREEHSELLTLRSEIATFKNAENERREAEIVSFVDTAIRERRICEEDRETYLTLARTNTAETRTILSKIAPAIDLSERRPSDENAKTAWEKRKEEINSNKQK